MPLYEYICTACEHEFEELTTMGRRDAKKECPQCGKKKIERKLSTFIAQQASAAPTALPPCAQSGSCPGHCQRG